MLTVWTVCVGEKYTDRDVQIVQHMVRENLSQDHEFRCLADRKIEGVLTTIPDTPWPGWWSKLLLFKYAKGQNLYLDLDVVVTGSLDGLVSEELSLPLNWARSGHGGFQSSVMSWGLKYPALWQNFNPSKLARPEGGNCGRYQGLWGDQEYITLTLGNIINPMSGICSYKYHCSQGVPKGMKVVCFHGSPKPSEVNDPWVTERRSM